MCLPLPRPNQGPPRPLQPGSRRKRVASVPREAVLLEPVRRRAPPRHLFVRLCVFSFVTSEERFPPGRKAEACIPPGPGLADARLSGDLNTEAVLAFRPLRAERAFQPGFPHPIFKAELFVAAFARGTVGLSSADKTENLSVAKVRRLFGGPTALSPLGAAKSWHQTFRPAERSQCPLPGAERPPTSAPPTPQAAPRLEF